MTKEKPKQQELLEAVFDNALNALPRDEASRQLAALNVQLDVSQGEIQVFDDAERLLDKNIIYDWAERSARGLNPYRLAVHSIGVALAQLRIRRAFDHPALTRPFSIHIVDDSFNTIQTVFTLDEQPAAANPDTPHEGRIMKNLEHELNIFYRKIFADSE